MEDKNWRFGTRIIMDEGNITREGIYSLNTIYENIDAIAKNIRIIKKDKYIYYAKQNRHSLEKVGIFTHNNLLEEKWFTKMQKSGLGLTNKTKNTT